MAVIRTTVLPRARRVWRIYTRMRTAILFLFAIAGLVVVGSFVPQQDTSAQSKVDAFQNAHPAVINLFQHMGLPLTEVFVSPVFLTVCGLLYGSLGACVLRRARALIRRVRRHHPRTSQFWGEWGSWSFHASFFVLLIAVLFGKLTGFQGLVEVTEGTVFSDSRGGYDQLQEGLLYNGDHSNVQMRLNSFHATYQPNGVAADYVSNVTLIDHGKEVQTADIRVNDPMSYNGVSYYQQDYGWAPHIVVTNTAGTVVFDGYIQMLPGATKAVGAGVLKVPDFGLKVPGNPQSVQMGAAISVFPDAHPTAALRADGSLDTNATQYVPGGEEARFPVVELKVYMGDLGLTRGPQNVNVLDTQNMVTLSQSGDPVPVVMGGTDTLPVFINGKEETFTVSFPDLRQFSLLMVKRDDGVPLVYVSFVMIMFGLLTKLYARPLLERRERNQREGGGDVEVTGKSATPEPVGAGAAPD